MFYILVRVHLQFFVYQQSFLPEFQITFNDWDMYHEVLVPKLSFTRQKENFICFNFNYFTKTLNLTICSMENSWVIF